MEVIAFGAEVCRNLVEGTRRKWLETSGLGGYACGTVAGPNTSRYQGVLVSPHRPGPVMLVNKVEDRVGHESRTCDLSANCYPNTVHPQGYMLLQGFRIDPWPVWTYEVAGAVIEREVFLPRGHSATVLRWRLVGGASEVRLFAHPLVSGRAIGALHNRNNALCTTIRGVPGGFSLQTYPSVPRLYVYHNGVLRQGPDWYYNFEYPDDEGGGLEDLYTPGHIEFTLRADRAAFAIFSAQSDHPQPLEELVLRESSRRRRLSVDFSPVPGALARAADHFICANQAAQPVVVAAYPQLAHRVRDTFISLEGLTLLTERFDEARQILASGAVGLVDLLSPAADTDAAEPDDPTRSLPDTPLWLIAAAHRYLAHTGDLDFVVQTLWPSLEAIGEWYARGTRLGVKMDRNGLLWTGSMANVAVQALWVNGLRALTQMAQEAHLDQKAAVFRELADRAERALNREFWFDEGGYLYHCISPSGRDGGLCAEQIHALSLPHVQMPPERARSALAAIQRNLVTAVGLRIRDRAQVCSSLVGPYVSAVFRVHGRSREAIDSVQRLLHSLVAHLSDAGLGTVSEAFDGAWPYKPCGAIAQAQAVAELIRAFAALEDRQPATGGS